MAGQDTTETDAAIQAAPSKKKLINFKVDRELHQWAKLYAAEHGTDVTKLLVAHLKELRDREDGIKSFLEIVRSDFRGAYILRKEDGRLVLESFSPPKKKK